MAAPETQGGLVRKEAVDQLSESTKTSNPLTVRAERSRIGSFGSYGMAFWGSVGFVGVKKRTDEVHS